MSFRMIQPVPGVLVEVSDGQLLLADLDAGPTLAAHRELFGTPTAVTFDELSHRVGALRGRGGAGFPFATKLAAVAERVLRHPGLSPVVVVNGAEGEPASAKDAVLLQLRPHLVLDGAQAAAAAVGATSLHVVVGSDATESAIRAAVAERGHEPVPGLRRPARWTVHRAADRFVAGQARAVIELISGRPNLPVTAWSPEAIAGYRGRPTLVSNAETFAQVGLALLRPDQVTSFGTADEPGTTLLTLGSGGRPDVVCEVAFGTGWRVVLGVERAWTSTVLIGGYHGIWARPGELATLPVSREKLNSAGLTLGAGVVQPLGPGHCPVDETARILTYLAGESAGRCGPCTNGLPALAAAVSALASGRDETRQVRRLVGLVEGRGACAHPDGTARLVRSLLAKFPDELDAHLSGDCGARGLTRQEAVL